METRAVSSSGLEVSVFGLGTMTFGDESDEATSHSILDRYVAREGRFIDTADVYTHGVSEEIIGRWLAGRSDRDEFVIATKARFPMGDDPADRGAGEAYLTRAVDASLTRLGVEVIDLYQMHAWDPETRLEETMGALNDFVEAGKVRWIGVSNYLGWQLERAWQIADRNGWSQIVSLQPQYNMLARDIELEIVPWCVDRGIGILPWSPLGGGWLTGKYSRYQAPTGATRLGEDPDRGVEAYGRRNTDRTWTILDRVSEIAAERGVSMEQVALNWLRSRTAVSSVLLGIRTVAQLEDNMDALEWNLSDDEMETLNDVSAPGLPDYPQGFLSNYAGYRIWAQLKTGESFSH